MGAIGVELNRNTNDSMKNRSNMEVNNIATQIIDTESQIILGDDLRGEGRDDCMQLISTMPIDDDYLSEDNFETQLVNLDGETQVMDYLDLDGETQVMDYPDDTQLINSAGETQVMNCAGETQIIESDCEPQSLDDVDCVKSTPSERLEKSNAQDNDAVSLSGDEGISKQYTSVGWCDAVDNYATKLCRDTSAVTVTNDEHLGSPKRDFTSIRTASFRTFGLVASARGANKISSGNEKSSLYHQQRCARGGSSIIGRLLQYGSKIVEEHPPNKVSDKPETTSKYEFGDTVVRRLFLDGQVSECSRSEADVNHLDNQTSQNRSVGLSYANSQEPGEQSQAEALEVVEKFLKDNVENDKSVDLLVRNAGKTSAVSAAKGSRDLAKVSILKRIYGQRSIYDWDVSREDECGGEFLQKKKGLLFGGPKQNLTSESLKRKCSVTNSAKEPILGKEKVMDTFYSDSRLLSRKMRPKRKAFKSEEEKKLSKNLSKEFDNGLKTVSAHRLADDDSSKDVADVETVGPDTQLAAEVMEGLSFEVPLAGNISADRVKGSTAKAIRKSRSTNRVDLTDECLTMERKCLNSVGAVTRPAKRRKPTSIGTGNECCVSAKKAKNVMKKPDKKLKKEKQETVDVSTHYVTESTGQMTEKMLYSDKQLYFCSPVAHRKRKRSQRTCSKAAGKSSIDREESSDILSARVSRKLRTSAKYKNVELGIVTKVRKSESAAPEKSGRSGKSKASDDDAMEHLKENEIRKGKLEASPQEIRKASDSSCVVPPPLATGTSVSPLCVGDEYHKQSCKAKQPRSSLVKEIKSILPQTPKTPAHTKDLRKRKDVLNTRVLFSQHLDDDTVKQQQKILNRLGGVVASSISDATHFVADEFVRTRNMLEAIAFGKPVVTHLWLDSCGQASCLIDEKNYILRDARKEKEFGFSLPASLSRACEHPLLQGYKVFITTNRKPGNDTLACLVKAVHGLVVERLGRSVLNNEKLPDDLLILSCEDDYDLCIPFLEKGGRVYSSELLLNGIVKQKLEFERHQIFADKVKRTRSTIWLKKKNHYRPVIKS